jgi:alkylation response protein AidB-like acyl-CoA dehydrogenase
MVDLTLSIEQKQIVDAAHSLLQRYAGSDRAKVLVSTDAYDHDLHARLDEAGFFDIINGDETGPLDAALVTLEVAKAAGGVTYGASAIVAPKVMGAKPEGPVALTRAPADFPVRMAQHAKLVLIDAGEEARALDVKPDDIVKIPSNRTGWPLAKLKPAAIERAKSLGPGTGETLRRWWRLALALETVGTMQSAFETTVSYVKTRVQFGRPIGEFQSLQHRLGELAVIIESARWMALEAAFRNADPLFATTAAGRAAGAANLVARESQQMHGAMGLTREYPLHVWSMRLAPLAAELGGADAHRRETARLRFSGQEIVRRASAFAH